jgi:hypothetical protein
VAVHRTYIGGLERGERSISIRSLQRYGERLGVDPMSLGTLVATPGERRLPMQG